MDAEQIYLQRLIQRLDKCHSAYTLQTIEQDIEKYPMLKDMYTAKLVDVGRHTGTSSTSGSTKNGVTEQSRVLFDKKKRLKSILTGNDDVVAGTVSTPFMKRTRTSSYPEQLDPPQNSTAESTRIVSGQEKRTTFTQEKELLFKDGTPLKQRKPNRFLHSPTFVSQEDGQGGSTRLNEEIHRQDQLTHSLLSLTSKLKSNAQTMQDKLQGEDRGVLEANEQMLEGHVHMMKGLGIRLRQTKSGMGSMFYLSCIGMIIVIVVFVFTFIVMRIF